MITDAEKSNTHVQQKKTFISKDAIAQPMSVNIDYVNDKGIFWEEEKEIKH